MFTDWKFRLRALLRRSAVERELDEELRLHFEKQVEQLLTSGLDRDEATRRARLAFGALEQVKEECRDARGTRFLDDLMRDVRYALRVLRRRPLSSATVVATLAVGIGLNAAVFSLVDWVLVRPLPYPAAHQLVRVFSTGANPVAGPASLTYSEVQTFARAKAFQASTAFSTATRIAVGHDLEPSHVVVARVTGDLFGTLGVYPDKGRVFAPGELTSAAPVIMVSDGLWRRRFSSDPQIAGRVVLIDGRPHTVVGVMPRNRGYPADADVWRPITAAEREDDDRELEMIARLADGIDLERADAEIQTLVGAPSSGFRSWSADNLQRADVRNVRAALRGLLVSTTLILFIACANVAGLLGARGTERISEMTMRGALGAGRTRLFQQLVTETLVLAVIGGAAGLIIGRWTLELLLSLAPAGLPRLTEVALDLRVIAVGVVATVMVGLIVGVVPAWRVSQLGYCGGPGGIGSARAFRRTKGRSVLVAAQAAMAIVLTVGAGLLARSLQHLLTIDHGFAPDRLIAIELNLRDAAVDDTRPLYRELIENAEAVRGVQSAAVALRQPQQLVSLRVPVRVRGRGVEDRATVTLRPVTSRYFETVGLRLVDGRDFSSDDRQNGPRVAIVNAAFVRDVLSGHHAVGARLTTDPAEDELSVVAVAADVTPGGEADRPALYVPIEQVPIGGGSLLVRVTDAPQSVIPALTSRIRTVAPRLPLDRIHEISKQVKAGQASTRFNTQLASALAMLALLLSAIGVYGLTAGEVSARWRELAVRLALGATSREALWSAMRPSTIALACGIGTGLLAALIATRWMSSLLHGIRPSDPATLIAVPALLGTIGIAAASLAAARVLRADPASALRSE